jgi:hypothetical protein
MSRDVHCCTHWLRPRTPPPPIHPSFGLVYEGAMVSLDRWHLFVTPRLKRYCGPAPVYPPCRLCICADRGHCSDTPPIVTDVEEAGRGDVSVDGPGRKGAPRYWLFGSIRQIERDAPFLSPKGDCVQSRDRLIDSCFDPSFLSGQNLKGSL